MPLEQTCAKRPERCREQGHLQMTDAPLKGVRVFVAEDEFLLALDLCDILNEAGAVVVGPARSQRDARAQLAAAGAVDVALLDLNLGDESSAAFALELRARGVPVILTTGYDAEDVPEPDAIRVLRAFSRSQIFRLPSQR